MKYLLYGANGYTAQIIIKESLKQGIELVLAGRNAAKIEQLANKLGLEFEVFDLKDTPKMLEVLSKYKVCLHTAGPFSQTAQAMIEACLQTKTHYLDITGEIGVFELAKSYHQKALDAGIMIMPGVGFDVVPSDCLANHLHNKMPDATHLELAFTSVGGALSHGTASTMIENLGEGSAARVNGKIKKVPVGHESKKINFGPVQHWAITIPWGDISTAYSSTKIPNIVVYTGVPKTSIQFMKFQRFFNPILKTNFVKKMAQKWVDKNITGPNEKQNEKGKSYLWGAVKNQAGETIEARLTCKEGYLLTALASILITQKALAGNVKMGYQTPASAYGSNVILEIEGSSFS